MQEPTRIGLEPTQTVRQRFVQVAKEPEVVNAIGWEGYSQLEPLVEQQLALLQRIDKEKKADPDAAIVRQLQTEYNALRVQRNDKLNEIEHPKLPWFKRFKFRQKPGRD